MAKKFEVGSIASMINKADKKSKKAKKQTIVETVEEDEALDSENTPPKAETVVKDKTKKKNKRKLSETLEESNVTQDVAVESEPKVNKKKKKKKNQQKNVVVEKVEDNVDDAEDIADDAEDIADDAGDTVEKPKGETKEVIREKRLRTLFVGNLPACFALKSLKQMLQEFGKVQSIRVRSVAPAKISLSKKTAYLAKQINENKKNVNAYVVFENAESVSKALKINGMNYEGHVIQADKVDENPSYDSSLSIFLGNLSFKATEDEVRQFFEDCGEIRNVRLVRDGKTGMGKGFGYVNFNNKDSAVLALQKDGQSLKGREIRVKANNYMNKNHTNKIKKNQKKFMAKNANSKEEAKGKPNLAGKVNGSKAAFAGEKANKKQTKTMKSKIKAKKIKKHGKKLAEILSK